MASIRERTPKSGETVWAVLFRHGGKQASKTFKNPKKAERFRVLVETLGADRALAELLTDGQPAGTTVDEIAVQFLAHKRQNVTSRTMIDYQRDYDNWIKPWFGHRAAETIDESDVQKWVDHMSRTLSPKSVGDRHMLLHSIYAFGKAKSRRMVTHNPCLETDMPKRARKPPKGTTVSEWRAILGAAAERNPDAHDLILFMGSIGWRWSEAAALAVRDVEDDGEFVWVDVTRVFRMVENKQVLVEDAAKSWAGFRRSRLPREAGDMLRRRIVGKAPRDFVFTNSRGNHWNQNTFLRTTWPTLVTKAKVGTDQRKPTPHWLRHMAVGVMAASGAPMHEIQRVIGHEDMKTTNKTYGSLVSTLSASTVDNMDVILSGRSTAHSIVTGTVIQHVLSPAPNIP